MMNIEVNGVFSQKTFLEANGPILNGPGAQKEYTAFILPKLDQRQKDAVDRAKKYAMEQSIKSVLLKQTQQHQQQQMSNLKRTQALVLLSRIYIGSISYELKEDTIRQAFLPFGPIKSISLSWDQMTNKHKGFAFVEYELPEAAQLALEQMNGVLMGGRNVKVGRPSNMPQAQPITEELLGDSKMHNRVYIGSVHMDLTADDLKTVFEAFGKIVACELEPEPTRPNRHRGFGYVEYETAQSAVDAISNMNMFDLGGQFLRVGKAITPPNTVLNPNMGASIMPTASAVAAASITAKVIAMEAEQVQTGISMPTTSSSSFTTQIATPPTQSQAFTSGSGVSSLPPPGIAIPPPPVVLPMPLHLTQPNVTNSPDTTSGTAVSSWDDVEKVDNNSVKQTAVGPVTSRYGSGMNILEQKTVMVLKNMVGPEECDEDLESEVTEECSKYGSVERVVIYQEKQSDDIDAEVIVKLFVVFEHPDSLQRAVQSLNGRFFGGRIVRAEVYDQDLFNANDLSH